MNLDQLQQKLLAAARAQPPRDEVPFGFEQRVLARLRGVRPADPWVWWVRGLWQAAASCAALALVLGAWVVLAPSAGSTAEPLDEQLENTVLAAVDEGNESVW